MEEELGHDNFLVFKTPKTPKETLCTILPVLSYGIGLMRAVLRSVGTTSFEKKKKVGTASDSPERGERTRMQSSGLKPQDVALQNRTGGLVVGARVYFVSVFKINLEENLADHPMGPNSGYSGSRLRHTRKEEQLHVAQANGNCLAQSRCLSGSNLLLSAMSMEPQRRLAVCIGQRRVTVGPRS